MPKEDQKAMELNLKPMHPLVIKEIENTSDLLRQMGNTAFTGRAMGDAADVLEAMIRDPQCTVVMTMSGAMTMAGLRNLIIEMVKRKWVHCIVSTGALVGHGLVEGLGLTHYKADPNVSDETYFHHRLNRVYDTIEPEENLNELEKITRRMFVEMSRERNGEPFGTYEMLEYFGKHLPGGGILQAAVQAQVPVIIPAFTDSELGLDYAIYQMMCKKEGKTPMPYDAFRDLNFFREFCVENGKVGKKLGIFTVGGGVPRNWAQQVGPFVDVINYRLNQGLPRLRFHYGVRICPDPVHYGHLSGCTYSEGVSWGKFVPKSEGGQYAEILTDATIAWPLLVRAMLDRGL